MPESLKTAHIIFTTIAFGILFGLGFALAHMAVTWPAGRVAGGAAVVCVLLVAFLI
jgi:hypothetical protein